MMASPLNVLSTSDSRPRLPPFHQDRPSERPEVIAVEREPELADLDEFEQRPQLSPELLLAYDRWTVLHRLLRIPREA